MDKKSLIVILLTLCSWLPWTQDAKILLKETEALIKFRHQTAYARGECCELDPPSFAINGQCQSKDVPMVTLHETQHLLALFYKSPSGQPLSEYWWTGEKWASFTNTAIKCAKEVEPQEMPAVLKFARLGPWELHAQLPWLLKGKLCPKLQPWYPWFDLD